MANNNSKKAYLLISCLENNPMGLFSSLDTAITALDQLSKKNGKTWPDVPDLPAYQINEYTLDQIQEDWNGVYDSIHGEID